VVVEVLRLVFHRAFVMLCVKHLTPHARDNALMPTRSR
jgi:hypothetical protein